MEWFGDIIYRALNIAEALNAAIGSHDDDGDMLVAFVLREISGNVIAGKTGHRQI